MGMLGTLAKMAAGYAAAKGVEKLTSGGGLGGLLGGNAQLPASEPIAEAQSQMANLMGDGNPMQAMMSMFQGGSGEAANPMESIMQAVQGSGFDLSALTGQDQDGGAGGLMGQLGGGAGIAGLLAAAGGAAAAGGSTMGGLLDAFNTKDTMPELEETAGLMLRAMIQAAKADGDIDEAEKTRILDTVGQDADAQDIAFVQEQLAAPLDAEALAADTPQAQRAQVYSASLMTIQVDTQAEAQYLDTLAKAMGLDQATVNALHMQMGIQPLYA
ncbi:MAG: tellurite resistance TerB family protein [Pelagimonas sp.]|nr:tellurite resistance TerB family protein [Pelagimonas sp.]